MAIFVATMSFFLRLVFPANEAILNTVYVSLFTYPNTISLLQLQVSTKDESVSNGSAKINGVLLNSSKSTNNSTNNSKSTKKSGVAGKSAAPSVIDCCEASTMTDPNLLGPCQPGTAVKLQGAVLQESEKGKMLLK